MVLFKNHTPALFLFEVLSGYPVMAAKPKAADAGGGKLLVQR
jgi:hypothetical protein